MKLYFYENKSMLKYTLLLLKDNLHILIFLRYLYKKTINSGMTKVKLNRIKSVLAEKNSSGKDLAYHLGKTESTVSRWCTNEVQPSVETLYEIAKFLNIDIRELLISTK